MPHATNKKDEEPISAKRWEARECLSRHNTRITNLSTQKHHSYSIQSNSVAASSIDTKEII